jgi:hypothetical protein
MRHRLQFFAFFTLASAALGCDGKVVSGALSGEPGGSAGAAGSGGASGSSGSASGGADPATTTLSAKMGPLTIQSGEEAVKCVVVSLGNPESVFVRKFRTTLKEGSHHMIVYTSDQPPDPTPYSCQSFDVQGGSAIFIAEQAKSELALPTHEDGTPVGLKLAPNQSLTMEMHYINTTSQPIDVLGTVEMDVLPLTSNVIPSGFSFRGDFNIPVIPAQSEADTGVLFEQGIPGTRVFALTTHQHHLGTRMQVWYADDMNDLSQPIADATNWADPPLELFNPPLEFPVGSDKGFAYQCHWKNPTPNDVYGGLSANDEMCFFWNYYYPSDG